MKFFPPSRRSFLLPVLAAAVLPLFAAATAHAQTPGDEDTSFAVGPQASNSVYALKLQTNGQVLVGGAFTTFRGASRSAVARLNADGSLDAFSPGLAITPYNNGTATVRALALQSNGQVIAAGIFNVAGQAAGGGVARLNADGSLDASFNVGTGILDDGGQVGTAYAVAVLANGQILVGGAFTSFDGVPVAGVVRLNANGSVDTSFNPGGGGVAYGGGLPDVRAIAVQADGRILIGGTFTSFDGAAAGGVARLNANGTLDTSFNVAGGASNGFVEALALQGDGQLLVGGSFTGFDGDSVPHLVRLHADGSLDLTYYPVNGVSINEVAAILEQPDGSAVIGGQVNIPEGLIYPPGDGLARINADGTQDTGFTSGGSDLRVASLALQNDGKLLIGANANGLVGVATGDVYRVYDLVLSGPTITIVPGVSKINEDGSSGPGTFIVTASYAPSSKIKVAYTIKGAAIPGFDYVTLSGKAKIKPGRTTATITINPINQGINDGSVVSVKLALLPGAGYTVGAPNVAKVKIVDNQ